MGCLEVVEEDDPERDDFAVGGRAVVEDDAGREEFAAGRGACIIDDDAGRDGAALGGRLAVEVDGRSFMVDCEVLASCVPINPRMGIRGKKLSGLDGKPSSIAADRSTTSGVEGLEVGVGKGRSKSSPRTGAV